MAASTGASARGSTRGSPRDAARGADRGSTRVSFEFFPPRSDAQARRFWRTFGALESLAPEYVSLTWGALGSDSRASLDLLGLLVRDTDIPITAHLSCVGQTREQLRTTLDELEALGVRRILALRGDAPSNTPDGARSAARADASERVVGATSSGGPSEEGGSVPFRHASELVALIDEERPGIDVGVAAYPEIHPEAADAASDLHWLRHKIECGASQAITQFFFEPEVFLRWRDRVRALGVDCPLVPGILPVHDIDKVQSFASKCGASVPGRLIERFSRTNDTASREALAIEECLTLCRTLEREGVDAFHLYTLNQSVLSRAIAGELLGTPAARAVAA